MKQQTSKNGTMLKMRSLHHAETYCLSKFVWGDFSFLTKTRHRFTWVEGDLILSSEYPS